MLGYFRPALCTAFLLIYFSNPTRGFPLPTFKLVATGTPSYKLPLLHPSYLCINGQAALPWSFCPRGSRACFLVPRVTTSSKDESSSLLGAAGLEMSGIVEFEEVPDASMSSISACDYRDDNSSVGNGRQDRVSSSSTLASTAAAAAPSLVPDTSTPEEQGVMWMEKAGSDQGLLGINCSIERLIGSVKQAAMRMEIVPVKSRADGRLDIDGQGLLNLCILTCSALWAFHAIATVDATVWRGWTLQETLLRLPWDNWGSYEVGLQEHPILTKTSINVGIYLIGDWLAQVNWGREENVALWEFDLKRTLRNGLIGAMFGPMVHYYYDFSDYILPPNVGTNRPLKIILDQTLYFVTKCTLYISLVSLLRGDSWEETKETVESRLKGVVTTGWRFWPFVHILTYFLIPPRHRVLWVNCVDLLWSSILASMTSGTPDADDAIEDDGERSGRPLRVGQPNSGIATYKEVHDTSS